MLTPGSLRAEAIRACFMEAGFTNSLFRTVLEDREGQAGLVCSLLVSDSTVLIQNSTGGKKRDGLVFVCVSVSFS